MMCGHCRFRAGRRALVVGALLLLALPLRAEPEEAALKLVASIRPLGLIASAVVGERGEVHTLLPAGASPHEYPLRVSDMQRLESADLVLWVGVELETFLHKPLERLPAERRLTLSSLSGLHWPEQEPHGPAEAEGHQHGERDPHLWLDPRNGARVALALAERLGERDPAGAEGYQSRARALAERLAGLDRHLTEHLTPLADRPFAVYHEGYAHFVQRYGLNQRAAVTVSPEQRPGARHLYQLRQELAGAHCLFTEPYYDMSAARNLAHELDLTLGELDPLGASEAVSNYPELLEGLADAVAECLAGE